MARDPVPAGKRLLLARHGAVDNASDFVYATLPGFPLSPHGRAQMRATAMRMRLSGAVRVVTSPLERAAESAAIIAEVVRRQPLVDERLVEIRNSYAGQRRADVLALLMDGQSGDLERHNDVRDRILHAIGDALSGPEDTIVAVSHLMPIRLACHALGAPVRDLPLAGFHDLRVERDAETGLPRLVSESRIQSARLSAEAT